MKKIRVDLIYQALAKRHQKDFFTTECKSGPTHMARPGELMIFDALAVKKSWTKPCITIYEVKVSRQDFLADHKWASYLQFCNLFYFVCPKGIIEKEELSNGIGLMTYNADSGALFTAKKAIYKPNPLPVNVFYYILMNKIESDKHPFFSNCREMAKAYVTDKEDRAMLGYLFKSKLVKEVVKLRKEIEDNNHATKSLKNRADGFDKMVSIIRQKGINVNYWDIDRFEKELTILLQSNINQRQEYLIKSIGEYAKELEESIK